MISFDTSVKLLNMIQKLFQHILNNYIDGSKITSNQSSSYRALVHDIPLLLNQRINRNDIYIRGSAGQGNKTDYPWICIFNRNITTSATNGIYLVYLFKKDMSGFYLSLNQGVTYFDDIYRSKRFEAIKKVTNYFKEKLPQSNFSTEPITLGANFKNEKGYGYQKCNILSKYYDSSSFSSDEIFNDLKEMIQIYDYIYEHMDTDDYKDIIQRIVTFKSSIDEQKINADEAIKQIKDVLDEVDGQPFNFSNPIHEVTPYVNRSNNLTEITNPSLKKTNWVKKARQDALNGLHGEGYAMIYERERLEKKGLSEYVDKVTQVSIKSDGYGYDIESFDLIGSKVEKIFIEVKSTTNKIDVPFQVSVGEVERSKILQNRYFLYRIYDLKKDPKIYRVQGAIPEHFELDPITYLAKYKG